MTHQQLSLPRIHAIRAEAQAARQRAFKRGGMAEKEVQRLAHELLREWVAEYQVNVSDLPAQERPVSRIEHYGPGALSATELLAIVVGGAQQLQVANRLLSHYDDGLIGLARAPFGELTNNGFQGIGPATAARIKAAFELGRRLLVASHDDRPQVRSPADAANLLMLEMSQLEQEHLRVVLLDSKNYVLGMPTIYVGNVNTAIVRVAELFREAIRVNAAAIIVVHNHPSGDPSPSPEDTALTEMVYRAGELMDIQVLDHIIIGQGRYISMKERGLGFPN